MASLLPDWNVLDSVRLAHSRLELWSIVFFGLLAFAEAITHRTKEEARKDRIDSVGIVFFVSVAFEGAAYVYGQRNDELSGDVINSLAFKAQNASDRAAKALTDSDNALVKSDAAKTSAGKALVKSRELQGEFIEASTKLIALEAERKALENSLKCGNLHISESHPSVGSKWEKQVLIR